MLISRVGLHGSESPRPSKRQHNNRHAQIDAEQKRPVRPAAANWIVREPPPDRTADRIAIDSWPLLSPRQKPLARARSVAKSRDGQKLWLPALVACRSRRRRVGRGRPASCRPPSRLQASPPLCGWPPPRPLARRRESIATTSYRRPPPPEPPPRFARPDEGNRHRSIATLRPSIVIGAQRQMLERGQLSS
jgi:hypothetical protein